MRRHGESPQPRREPPPAPGLSGRPSRALPSLHGSWFARPSRAGRRRPDGASRDRRGENVLLVSPTGTGRRSPHSSSRSIGSSRAVWRGTTPGPSVALRLSSEGARQRRPPQPRAPPPRHPAQVGADRVPVTAAVRTGDTSVRRPVAPAKDAARRPDHDARIALHPPDRVGTPISRGLDGDPRRGPLDRGDEAGSHLALSLERLEELLARAGAPRRSGSPSRRRSRRSTSSPPSPPGRGARSARRRRGEEEARPDRDLSGERLPLAPRRLGLGPGDRDDRQRGRGPEDDLVFCNNRRLAEKVARKLSDAPGPRSRRTTAPCRARCARRSRRR